MTKENFSRVLITGGSGFIGTNLVDYYVNSGSEVVNIDIEPPRNSLHGRYWLNVDLLDLDSLRSAIADVQPTVILHMGARTDLDGASVGDYEANTTGVRNLILAASNVSIERMIFASSRLVCRIGYNPSDMNDYCPTTPYGESKVLGEMIVNQESHRIRCPWVIVRPTSIWGPWFGVPYRSFFDTISRGRYFHPGKSKVYKSFGFVGNTVHQIDSLLRADSDLIERKTLYLADYDPIEIGDFSEIICREFNIGEIRRLPISVLRVIASVGDILRACGWKTPPLTNFRLNNILTTMIHELSDLKRIAGELPYSLEEGVAKTVDWLNSQSGRK